MGNLGEKVTLLNRGLNVMMIFQLCEIKDLRIREMNRQDDMFQAGGEMICESQPQSENLEFLPGKTKENLETERIIVLSSSLMLNGITTIAARGTRLFSSIAPPEAHDSAFLHQFSSFFGNLRVGREFGRGSPVVSGEDGSLDERMGYKAAAN